MKIILDTVPLIYSGGAEGRTAFHLFHELLTLDRDTEAVACGSPVVASNRSSLPETVGEAALLTDPDDPNRIAQDVAAVLTIGRLRQALVRRGFERVAQLSWPESARRLIGVYRQIERARE